MFRKLAVAIYLRVSTDLQSASLDTQRKIIEERILQHPDFRDQYSVVCEESDKGVDGQRLETRPGLQRIFRAAEQGTVDVVIVYDLSRFGRFDAIKLGAAWDQLRNNGVRFLHPASGCQRLDVRKQTDRMQAIFMVEMAHAENQQKARDKVLKNLQKAKNGERPCGKLPEPVAGVDAANRRIDWSPEWIPVVREMFAAYVGGEPRDAVDVVVASGLKPNTTRQAL